MTDAEMMLKAFDDYMDAHEPDIAKREDKKQFVHWQVARLPFDSLKKTIIRSALDAAKFRYE